MARHEQGIKSMVAHLRDMPRERELTPCKETLLSHEIPEGAWKKIGADLFTYHNKEYLVTVCYRCNS